MVWGTTRGAKPCTKPCTLDLRKALVRGPLQAMQTLQTLFPVLTHGGGPNTLVYVGAEEVKQTLQTLHRPHPDDGPDPGAASAGGWSASESHPPPASRDPGRGPSCGCRP